MGHTECLERISGFYYLPPDGGLDKCVTIHENHVPCSGKKMLIKASPCQWCKL